MTDSSILPVVDEPATIKNVANFLTKTLPKMARISGYGMAGIKDLNVNDLPTELPNWDENITIVRYKTAQMIVKQTLTAIEAVRNIPIKGKHNETCYQILRMLYVQQSSDTECCKNLDILKVRIITHGSLGRYCSLQIVIYWIIYTYLSNL